MTREEIMKMEAGPELDALIADKVMGWNFPHIRLINTRFSTDISAAWQVVEKMREKGRHFLFLMSHESGLAIATFYLGPHDRSDLSATEEWNNTPLAICRAALLANRNTA